MYSWSTYNLRRTMSAVIFCSNSYCGTPGTRVLFKYSTLFHLVHVLVDSLLYAWICTVRLFLLRQVLAVLLVQEGTLRCLRYIYLALEVTRKKRCNIVSIESILFACGRCKRGFIKCSSKCCTKFVACGVRSLAVCFNCTGHFFQGYKYRRNVS